jgi:Fe2+ or Zn2+ uptake regulation protein
VPLDECGLQAAAGGIERDPGSGDAAPDDEDVEPLVGQASEGVLASEPVHRPSLSYGVTGSSGRARAELTIIVNKADSRYGGPDMQSPDALTELFRAHGRKITAQRQCIFRALEGDVTHPSAERVYERVRTEMPNVSLKTVYQTLHDLSELGQISALDLGTGAVRFDPNVEATHHHVVCRGCGKVRDVNADFPGLAVPPGAAPGFDVLSAEVVFRGLCDGCREDRP